MMTVLRGHLYRRQHVVEKQLRSIARKCNSKNVSSLQLRSGKSHGDGLATISSSYRNNRDAQQQQQQQRLLSSSSSTKYPFFVPSSPTKRILLGCVSYDPAVGQIWDGIKQYLNSSHGGKLGPSTFDYVLFTNYEQQVSALLEGHIDVAWNGPIAHVMAEDLAAVKSEEEGSHNRRRIESIGMRDVDRDFQSIALIRQDCIEEDSPQITSKVFKGKTIATGSIDSPQGHIVPVDWLQRTCGIDGATIVSHDIDLGKHGDTAVGEIMALQSMLDSAAKRADGALISNMMYQRGLTGQLDGIDPNELKQTVIKIHDEPPTFDHCCFDALVVDDDDADDENRESSSHRSKINAFSKAILSMDMKDPLQEPIMKMEGIDKCWMPSRIDPNGAVRTALFRQGLALATAPATKNYIRQQQRTFSSSSSASSESKGGGGESVAIIGAGVSGLQTIRALRAKGFDVTAFDADNGVGGLWKDNYLDFGVQVPKQLFEFPDFPFKEVPDGDFPTGIEVQEYIERYTDHFQLHDHIQLNTRVESVTQNEDGSWTIQATSTGSGASKEESSNHRFDKLVVSTGMYASDRPSFPEAVVTEDAKKNFKGDIIHTNEVRRPEQVKDKKVVVIGGGKSAIDVAVTSSNVGAEKVTLLSRNPHWPTPRKIADLIPFQYVLLSRLGQNLVLGWSGPLPGCSPAHSKLWHSIGQYVMPPIFKVVELLFAAQYRNVTGPTSPFFKVGVVEDFYGYAQVLDYSLRDKVASGDIDWRIGSIANVESDGAIVLDDGDHVEADVVICGTGFEKDYSIFDDQTVENLNVESDGLYLFNHTIPTHVDNLAFVGSELAVISNISGYALQAAWLSKLWAGELSDDVSDKTLMEQEVQELKEWKRRWMPFTSSRASLVLLHQIHFYDRLLQDMGMEKKRKSNLLAEWFMPYESRNYDGVLTSLETAKLETAKA